MTKKQDQDDSSEIPEERIDEEAETETKTEDDVVEYDHNQMVDLDTFKGFVFELEENESKTQKLSGEKAAIFDRAEKAHIHKAALKNVMTLKHMPEPSRIAYRKHHAIYCEFLGIDIDEQASFNLDESLEEKS